MSEDSPDLETAAQDELLEAVDYLKDVDRRVRAIHQRLAVPSERERTLDVEDEKDVSTEIRSVIECVLADSLGPAIRDLEAAAHYGRPRGR